MNNGQAVLLSVVLEANDDGYLASAPGMQGAFAEGDTVEEAVFNCVDVAKLILAYRAERDDRPALNRIELTSNMRMTMSIPVGVACMENCGN
jgi:predicted RNase H-like HicB family nuclease